MRGSYASSSARRGGVVSNRGDFAALDRMIASCRAVEQLPREAAPIVAQNVEAALRATAAAGQAPDGTPWERTKKDGALALKGAAAAIAGKALGTVVLITLTGHYVFHHFGAQGKPRRQVIPQGSMPAKLGNAVRLGFVQPWRELVKGKGK
jgi:hypothetical protein